MQKAKVKFKTKKEGSIQAPSCQKPSAKSYKLEASAGYTLVEMLVVIGIALTVLAAIVVSVQAFYKSNSQTLSQAYAVEGARQGMERSVTLVRGIRYGADGSYPLVAVDANSFTFHSDINRDGIPERVHLYLSGTKFIEGIAYSSGNPPAYWVGEDTRTLSEYVRNSALGTSIFRYYNAADTELFSISTSNPVAYVTITLIVNQNPSVIQDYTLRSTAALRNVSQF